MNGEEKDDTRPAATALAWLREEIARAPYHHFLEPEPISADSESGTVVVALKAKEAFRRGPDGEEWHGGAIASLIDLAGHAAVALRTRTMAPTVDLRIDFIRPAVGDLFATSRLIRAGRSIARADVEVRDGEGRLVALGRGVFSTARAD